MGIAGDRARGERWEHRGEKLKTMNVPTQGTGPPRLLGISTASGAGALVSYILPPVSSASRTCASVKLEDFGYFWMIVR